MKRYKCKKSIHLNQGEKKLSKLNRIRRKLVSKLIFAEQGKNEESIMEYLKKIAKIDKNRFRMAKNFSLNLGGVYEYPD